MLRHILIAGAVALASSVSTHAAQQQTNPLTKREEQKKSDVTSSSFDKKVQCAHFRDYIAQYLLNNSPKDKIQSFIHLIIYSPKLDTCVVSVSTYFGDPGDPSPGYLMQMTDVLTGANIDSHSAT